MQKPHTPLDRFAGIFPKTPLCQIVIALSGVLLALLSLMLTSLTLIISYIARACLMSSHANPFYISFATWFLIFYWEGTFPQVSLSYTCVLALSIGMFRCLELVCFPIDTHLLLVCNYKALLFFFKLFKIFEKFQKKLENQKAGQKNMLSLAAVESCRLRIEHCISHMLVGLIVWI